MVSKRRVIGLAASVVVVELMVSNPIAARVPGYVQDSQEEAFRDSYGECLRAPESPADGPDVRCEPDRDGDGVADANDECPDTPKGVPVGARGCDFDGDGDGVPDDRDRCPNTSPGSQVDEAGCSPDGDGDGVADALDRCPDTAAGAKVDARGCEVIGDVVLSAAGEVNFKHDRAGLTDQAKAWLDERVAAYKRAADRGRISEIWIIGHTDTAGDAAYNKALSARRASAVGRYLVEQGIPADLIVVEGRGESDPVASNATKEGRARNRRVEIDVTTTEE